jgi:hypothetical protein
MRFFSTLGTEDFFFLVLPLMYWSIDASLGMRVGFILVTSDMFNYMIKLAFAGPRPYWVSSHVRGLWSETSFGIPSGHAQNAMSVWGIIALYMSRSWAWIIAAFLILLIGVSRIFLGAHFPHDVLMGWILGGLLLFLFSRLGDSVAAWFAGMKFNRRIIAGFLASLLFIAAGYSLAIARSDFQVPGQWVSNALLAGPAPAPVDPNGIFTSAGTFFGLTAGVAWMMQRGGYQVAGPVWKRALRYLIGLAGVLLFWMGLGEVLPRGDGFVYYLLRYLRYALVGWWVAGGAPWFFHRIRV